MKVKSEITGPAVKDEMEENELPVGKTDMSPEEVRKWIKTFMRKIERLFIRQSKYMHDNNQTTECLLLFLDKYPELFASEYGEINRDMIKWSLSKNMDYNRLLIDKIQEIEKKLNLEIHQIW